MLSCTVYVVMYSLCCHVHFAEVDSKLAGSIAVDGNSDSFRKYINPAT